MAPDDYGEGMAPDETMGLSEEMSPKEPWLSLISFIDDPAIVYELLNSCSAETFEPFTWFLVTLGYSSFQVLRNLLDNSFCDLTTS
ncbi:uncharacterized protein A4U43_C01F3950 [Asparagus officinalis]|uniref:Uncharacterized protein n=1 Tax=Asparagus officinalis TaxID=4686 RepID=A0A5P1FR62_ASPOF|nr:uncharacterized protein A4U43_C01F3950 [Asparagus officinalis]